MQQRAGRLVAATDPVDDEFWAALRALPDLQRNLAVLFYVDDLAVDRIAEVLDVALPPVGSEFGAAWVDGEGFFRLEQSGPPPEWDVVHYQLP